MGVSYRPENPFAPRAKSYRPENPFAPATADRAAEQAKRDLETRREDISPVEDFALGVTKGLANTGTAAVRAIGALGRLMSGVPAPGARPAATPPRARTVLKGPEEERFQAWYRGWAEKAGLDANPDAPEHKYDYRGAFRAGTVPEVNAEDGFYHWPSSFKDDDHPNRFVGGEDTRAVDRRGATDPLTAWADRTDREVEAHYDPQGTAGKAGTIGGRLLGEAAVALAGGRGTGAAIEKLAPGSAAAKAITAGKAGTVGQRVAANVAPFVPIDFAMGAGGSEEGFVLPGRAGAGIESVLMGAVPGGLIEGGLARRDLIREALEQAGTARATAAGHAAEAAWNRRISEGAEALRESNARARRVPVPITKETMIPRQQYASGAGPATEEVAQAAERAGALQREAQEAALRASPEDIATYRTNRDMNAGVRERVLSNSDRAQEAAAIRAVEAADAGLKGSARSETGRLPSNLKNVETSALEREYDRLRELQATAEGELAGLDELPEAFAARELLSEGHLEDAAGLVSPDAFRGQALTRGQAKSRSLAIQRIEAELARRAEDPATAFPFGENLKNRSGSAQPAVVNTVGGAAVGAAVGSAVGDTPEERRRNVAIGAVAGAGAGASASALLRAATRAKPAAALHASNPDVAAVAATIKRGDRVAPGPKGQLLTFAERQYQSLVNESYAAEKLGRMAGTGEAVKEAVATSHGWQGAASQFLKDEFKPVLAAAKGREADVMALVKARRDLDLVAKGAADKTGLDKAMVARARAALEADPATAAAADALQGFYRRLQEMKLEAGVISQDIFDGLAKAEDFYTPFVREWDDAVQPVGRGGGGGKNVQKGTGNRKMDREQQARAATVDPFEVAVQDAGETFRAIAKQRVTNAVVSAYTANPAAVSPFLKAVGATDPVKPGARIVEANLGGTRQRFEVTDPDLYDAWGAFDQRTMNLFMKVLNAGKRTLQTGVTLLPDFALANVARDATQASIQQRAVGGRIAAGAAAGAGIGAATGDDEDAAVVRALKGAGYGAGAAVLGPQVAKNLSAVADIVGGRAVYQQFLRDGGYTMGFYPRDPGSARKVLEQLRSSGVSPRDVVSPRKWLDVVQAIGSVSEQSTRLAKYKDATKAGATAAQAALAAQDVSLRFSQVGRDTKGIASVTAFWNAKVQGWDKLARMLKNPKTWALGAATITGPSLALWETNKDNPEYWARPQWERNMFWLVPKGGESGGFWRVPKPFEIGFLFASLPERLADYAANTGAVASASPFVGDTRPGESARAAVGDMARTTLDGTLPIPTLPMAVAEQAFNFDTFRNRKVVSRPDLPAEQQQDEYTSSLGVAAGQAGISPQRFDKAVRDLFGSSGSLALQGIDRLARAVGWDERPAPPNARRPLVGRFETSAGVMSDAEATMRRRFDGAERAHRGFTNLQKQGAAPEAVQRYVDAHRADLQEYLELKEFVGQADKLRDVRRKLSADRSLTAEQRKRLQEQVAAVNAEIAARALKASRRGVVSQGVTP